MNQNNQQNLTITIETDAFMTKAESLVDQLFQKAKDNDEGEFIPACLYFTGTMFFSDEYDTFKSLRDFHNDLYDLVQIDELQGNSKIRLMMMYYCHLIELNAYYEFIYNLAGIADGLPNEVQPFKRKTLTDKEILEKIDIICSLDNENRKLKEFKQLTKKMIPISVSQKIQMIQKRLATIGLSELGEMIGCFHNKDIRNSFSHNSYNVYGANIQLFSGGTRKISFQEFLELFMKTSNFFALLAEKAINVKRQLADGKKHEYSGKFGEFSIQFIAESETTQGSFQISSKKKTGSI